MIRSKSVHILRQRLLMDFVVLLFSRGAGQLITIGVGLLLVRVMADSDFGAYSLATTTIGLIGVIADFGLDVILTREIAADPQQTTSLLRRSIALRLAIGIGVGIGAAGLAFISTTPGRFDL